MILFAAVIAVAILFSPVAYAAQDTKTINSALTSTSGPGPDVAVGSDGKIYVSLGSANDLRVEAGSYGSTSQKYSVNTGGPVRLTAIGLTKADTVVVAAALGTDTTVKLYYATSSSVSGLSALTSFIVPNFAGPETNGGPSGIQMRISGLDIAVNDSFIVVVSTLARVTGDTDRGGETFPSTFTAIYEYDTAVNAPVLSDSPVGAFTGTDTGSAVQPQVVFDPASGESGAVIWIVKTTLTSAWTTGDTGVSLWKVRIGTDTGRGRVIDAVQVFQGLGDSYTIGRISVENVTGSDTRSSVTVAIAGDTSTCGNIKVLEFRDSRFTVPDATLATFGRLQDTPPDTIVVDFDTGLSVPFYTVRSMSYGRSSATHGWVLSLAKPSDLSSKADTIMAFVQSTLGGSSFTFDTATTSAANINRDVGMNLSGAVRDGTFYTVGWDSGPKFVFATKLSLGSSETKKKAGGVCVLDRMIGGTSFANAIFPSLKSFRDTLLGSDFGRKMVGLYYTF